MSLWLLGGFAAVVVALATWPLKHWLVHRAIMDQPDEHRKIHQKPTPRGGGLAIALALVWVWLISAPGNLQGITVAWVSAFVILVTGLGWLEDLGPRPVRFRLAVQFGLAGMLVLALGPIDRVSIGLIESASPWIWTGLGMIAVVWLMNLHNFMDGADGLAASQGAWCGLCFAVLFAQHDAPVWAGLAAGLTGGCVGFLLWNRPTAAIFMGDSGSLLVGGVIGLLAYQGVASGAVSLAMCLMICSVFVMDATATLVRRVSQGQRWYTPHASHAFQCLIAGGVSHGQLLAVYVGINLIIVLPAMLISHFMPNWAGVPLLVLYASLFVAWWQVQRIAKEPNKKG